jgi:hypothetical protein
MKGNCNKMQNISKGIIGSYGDDLTDEPEKVKYGKT